MLIFLVKWHRFLTIWLIAIIFDITKYYDYVILRWLEINIISFDNNDIIISKDGIGFHRKGTAIR